MDYANCEEPNQHLTINNGAQKALSNDKNDQNKGKNHKDGVEAIEQDSIKKDDSGDLVYEVPYLIEMLHDKNKAKKSYFLYLPLSPYFQTLSGKNIQNITKYARMAISATIKVLSKVDPTKVPFSSIVSVFRENPLISIIDGGEMRVKEFFKIETDIKSNKNLVAQLFDWY